MKSKPLQDELLTCRQPRPGNTQPARQALTTKPLTEQNIRELSSNASQSLWQRRNVVRWVSLLSGATRTHQDHNFAGCSDVFVVVM